jgi:hypothetical protein
MVSNSLTDSAICAYKRRVRKDQKVKKSKKKAPTLSKPNIGALKQKQMRTKLYREEDSGPIDRMKLYKRRYSSRTFRYGYLVTT